MKREQIYTLLVSIRDEHIKTIYKDVPDYRYEYCREESFDVEDGWYAVTWKELYSCFGLNYDAELVLDVVAVRKMTAIEKCRFILWVFYSASMELWGKFTSMWRPVWTVDELNGGLGLNMVENVSLWTALRVRWQKHNSPEHKKYSWFTDFSDKEKNKYLKYEIKR